MLPGLLFFPYLPQVEVILQQLPHHLPAPLVQELFQPGGRKPGRSGAGELARQRGEHGFRHGERIIRRDRGIRFHEGSSLRDPPG